MILKARSFLFYCAPSDSIERKTIEAGINEGYKEIHSKTLTKPI